MKLLIPALLVFIFFAISSAQVKLEVVYPKPDQHLPDIDSTFIFGNVTKGAEVKINGFEIPVHKDGGWLAYLPVDGQLSNFNISAVKGNDTTDHRLHVWVGFPFDSIDKYKQIKRILMIPIPLLSDAEVIYSVNSVFEFSFEAQSGGLGWFRVGESDSVRMYESGFSGSAIMMGLQYSGNTWPRVYSVYSGYYRFKTEDIGRKCVYYRFQPNEEKSSSDYPFRSDYLCTDSIITVLPEFPPVIGMLSGRSQIVRTGPHLGYKLLYQPAGVKVHVTGAESDYYKIKLAEGITGYTNVDSVKLLPPGTAMPRGRISFISVDKIDGGVEISSHIGERLPYEINETLSPPGLDIDIFGATGDVDWIRYNAHEEFLKLVKWSQPADGVFRISTEFEAAGIGGYQPYYDGNRFVIRIKKRSRSNPLFSSPVKGSKIVIDPGHSHDSGAVGPTGLNEKDANLWIAHELRLMLERKGAEVLMTRYGHEDVALYDRPKMAEKWEADLLISIHNNALPDGINPFYNNGASVYYYHPHSKPLAEAIHKYLLKETDLPDHGLYYGNLVLTRPTSMPAVLVECAFMIIPEQEALLKTDKFQRKCAKAIFKGIEEYLRR